MGAYSFLYASNVDLTPQGIQSAENIIGLSEVNYYIPISFKILVSQNPRIYCILHEEGSVEVGIQGDFLAGKKRLFEFYENLLSRSLFDTIELKNDIDEAYTFLNDDSRQLKYAILDCTDIFPLHAEPIEEQNKELYTFVLDIEDHIKEYLQEWEQNKKDIDELDKQLKALQVNASSLNDNTQQVGKEAEQLQKKIKDLRMHMIRSLGAFFGPIIGIDL